MESVWNKPQLADEIMQNEAIFDQVQSIISDILSNRIEIACIVENMAGVLTDKDAENREKGMRFFTKILVNIPKVYLNEFQVKFITKFYIDRLKDNHRVLPQVLEGYLAIIDMKNYDVQLSGEFFSTLFREVTCQSQLKHERYNIYLILSRLMEKDTEYMKTLGPDFVYGVISSIDGERDPRNLVFLFSVLPTFLANVPLGHLVEEMFNVIACYFPVDFHPPDEPAAVSRQDLADALTPCLCAVPDFGQHCLVLLIEKLDSTLRMAKIDSLKLLTESCKNLKAETFTPFLKALWSSIHREIFHKTDEELVRKSHEALSALVAKLSTIANTDQAFENFVKTILITIQTSIAEATTGVQFVQACRVLLTTANASKESCIIITTMMIPSTIAFYEFKTTSPKLQITSLAFLGDLYDIAKKWEVLNLLEKQARDIPQQCLTAVSQPSKEYQIAGFTLLIRVIHSLESDLVVPFVEVLMHNVQSSQDSDLLSKSVETINCIARKYPEMIMSLVVKGKCNLDNLMQDQEALQKRLNLLSNLASVDEFTKIIIVEMLKHISESDKDAVKVVEALSGSISNSSLYSEQKVTQIDSDHGLVESVLTWLYKEIQGNAIESLSHGFALVSSTIASLPAEKQFKVLHEHSSKLVETCKNDERRYLILESLYNSLHQNVYEENFHEILRISLNMSLNSEDELVRLKSCALTAHILNKAEFGSKFELLYDTLKNYLTTCRRDETMCPRLIHLYGWITKALVMRGCDLFLFWLQKVIVALVSPEYSSNASESIRLIMTDCPDYLTTRQHCRLSLLYKQRMFLTFSSLTQKMEVKDEIRENYLLSWAYVMGKAPQSVLNNEAPKITPLLIDSLNIDNPELLLVMVDVLCNFAKAGHMAVSDSFQTILPRLVKLSTYVKSMDVRIKSVACLYEIANSYSTMLLLPHKQNILFDLAPSLDDKKRLVRNMAVKARTRWYLVGAPGEAKEN